MTPNTTHPAGTAGFTLIETIVALTILVIVAAGVMPLAVVAVKATENQGHLAARTTEYAQDKLEQLMALSYGDSTTDTRVFPSNPAGGTGLTIGGSDNPAAPVDKYVDYLDQDGKLMDGADDAGNKWFYKRVWAISSPRAFLKRISVTATVRVSAQGGIGEAPHSTVSALKTDPF